MRCLDRFMCITYKGIWQWIREICFLKRIPSELAIVRKKEVSEEPVILLIPLRQYHHSLSWVTSDMTRLHSGDCRRATLTVGLSILAVFSTLSNAMVLRKQGLWQPLEMVCKLRRALFNTWDGLSLVPAFVVMWFIESMGSIYCVFVIFTLYL